MKGSPSEPRCGFSKTTVGILAEYNVEYKTFDILTDNEVVVYFVGRVIIKVNAVKYVFSANTVLILIQYFLAQISVLKLTEFFIARN